MNKVRLAVCGYGNLGKAAIENLKYFEEFSLEAVVSRRADLEGLPCPVVNYDNALKLKDKIDIMLMCGGSATDLPVQSPYFAEHFNIVDSFDTHADILTHRERVNKSALKGGKTAVISVGWDPGLFSVARAMFTAFLPNGKDYTFWGEGVSQGHSDAIRRIDGVKKAVQYTVPIEEAVVKARSGENPSLSTKEKHKRVCFIVASDSADKAKIEKEVVTMPKYFADYDTYVNFITDEEFDKNHKGLPHGGFVLRSGSTANGSKQLLELSLKLGSNPQFTSSVMLSYARATYRLFAEKKYGCFTAFDIAPSYLCEGSIEENIKRLL